MPRPRIFTPTADRPARLWVVGGDSLTESFGPALVNRSEATGVVEARREVRYSSGLTRPELFDWPAHMEAELGGRPTDVVLVFFMVGANDGQPIQAPAGWAAFGTDEWTAEYRHRVAVMMELLEEWVPTVYWVGQPIARSDDYSGRVAVMNEIYRSEAVRHPGVRYVDAWTLFADDQGRYSAYLPDDSGRMVLMRRSDGIHLTAAGGDRLAQSVLEAVGRDWPIKP